MSFSQKIPPEVYDPEYLADLENRISDAFSNLEVSIINLTPLYAQPDKLTKGDIFNADGTEYDPGSGEGPYFYNGSTLIKL